MGMYLRNFPKIRRVAKTAENTKKEKRVMIKNGKKLWWSKTFWVNFLTGSASVLIAVSGLTILPDSISSYLVTGLAVVNILLRLITGKPIIFEK